MSDKLNMLEKNKNLLISSFKELEKIVDAKIVNLNDQKMIIADLEKKITQLEEDKINLENKNTSLNHKYNELKKTAEEAIKELDAEINNITKNVLGEN